MTKYRIKWFGIATILLIAFIFLTPITLFFGVTTSVVISMIESAVCAFFVGLGIINLKNFDELDKLNDKEFSKRLGTSELIMCFICFFILGTIIYKGINARVDYKLKNDGVFTTARILDGEHITKKSLRGRRSDTYNIEIIYKDTLRNKRYKFKTEINSDIFNSLSKNQEVEIVYLPEAPSIFKIMAGDNVTTFKNVSNRDLNFTDFERLLDSENIENEISYLDSISFGWKKDVRENTVMFGNELKGEYVGLTEDGILYYQGENIGELMNSNQFLNIERFPKDENEIFTSKTLYETETLSIIKVNEANFDSRGNNIIDEYLLIQQKW